MRLSHIEESRINATQASGLMPRVVRRGFYRRDLPHLQRDFKPHFVTFCTFKRSILPPLARKIVLDCCIHDHDKKYSLYVTVVMPDHVHLILTPLVNHEAREIWSLASIMDAIKGASAHQINRALNRKGRVWQTESFDHVLRSSESLDAKVAYILKSGSPWTGGPVGRVPMGLEEA